MSDFNDFLNFLEILHREGKCINGLSEQDIRKISELGPYFRSLDGSICFRSLVPVALKALSVGASPESVSEFLDWRDFEALVLDYLLLNGFEVIRSLRLKSRRFELDVVGFDPISKYAIVIDCKHWTPGYSKKSKLKDVARKHREKVELMIKDCVVLKDKYPFLLKAGWFVPAVVTLTESLRGYINGSFIIPITALSDFISHMQYYIDVLSEFTGRIKNECRNLET